jgi:DNA repair protein RadC
METCRSRQCGGERVATRFFWVRHVSNRALRNYSSAELIALATGRRGASAYGDAIRLVEKMGLKKLADAGVAEIQAICGGMRTEAVQRLMAGVEIGLRIAELKSEYESDVRITGPGAAIQFCLQRFGRMARESQQEEFWIVTLNTKNVPIDCHQITVGTLRNSLVHPREVFRPAIRDAANCIIAVYNHPSGDPTPSDQDISVTERLEQTAEVVGIPLIDHIVVGIEKAISIQEWRSGNPC